MGTYSLVVMSNPVAGQEERFNEWYEHTHIPQLLQLDGVVAAHRYRTVDVDPALGTPSHRYIAIYELDTDDPRPVHEAMSAAGASGELVMSDALDTASISILYLESLPDQVAS